jgi:hypothetical protein
MRDAPRGGVLSRANGAAIDAPCVLASRHVPRVMHRGDFPDRPYAATMKTVVPTETWLKSHSASGIRMRMQPCEAE